MCHTQNDNNNSNNCNHENNTNMCIYIYTRIFQKGILLHPDTSPRRTDSRRTELKQNVGKGLDVIS